MINYTLEEAKILAVEVANYFKDKDLQTWIDIIDAGMKEFSNDVSEAILELLGPYSFTFTRDFSKKIGMTDMIFSTPVDEMPLYIASEDGWTKVIARWRLTIQK